MRSILIFLNFAFVIHSAKILVIFHVPMTSHHIIGEALVQALAAKNHEVTMITALPLQEPNSTIHTIYLDGIKAIFEATFQKSFVENRNLSKILQLSKALQVLQPITEFVFSHQLVRELPLQKKYDVIIVDNLLNDAFLAYTKQFNVPVIYFVTLGYNYLPCLMFRCIPPYSHVPFNLLSQTPAMSFTERLFNTIHITFYDILMNTLHISQANQLVQKYYPNSPPLEQLMEQVSLFLYNTHYSIDYPMPMNPNSIPVAGMHIKEPKQLPARLQQFLDGAEHGAILFSLGSNLKSSNLPQEKLQGILKAFSKLPYRILWKFEDILDNIPANVMIEKWLPQNDILGHENMRCFITQAGALSFTEAIYHGVPMIGIPFYADQLYNARKLDYFGIGIGLRLQDFDGETLASTIYAIMSNHSYIDNIKERSRILRDQSMKPIDKTVYWIEYVIRHNGSRFLQTNALHLQWYQYYMIDVIGFIILIVFAVLFGAIAIVRFCINLCCRKRKVKSD